MRTYMVFYKNNKIEVFAESSYAAQEAGARALKAKKSWQCRVVLADEVIKTSNL